MDIVRSFDRQTRLAVMMVGLVVAIATLVFIPVLTSAAQVANRSIVLSSASINATATYQVNFTPETTGAGAFVVDFCTNSPLLGQECDVPAGLNVAGAAAAANVDNLSASTLRVTQALTQGSETTVELEGIVNPSAAGTVYARIATFATEAAADDYVSATPGAVIDSGSVALAFTPTISVSGQVLESLTFCVSGAPIDANCTVDPLAPPVLRLGVQTGDVIALDPNALSEGSLYTQISTNAVNGAIVRLQSDATDCGGLVRLGAVDNEAGCGIAPALGADIAAGQARFGVKTTTATPTAEHPDATGIFRPYEPPVGDAFYGNGLFAMNYVAENNEGVTSTYGDPFLDTGNAFVNNMNMELIFGASASNNTPAGDYSANLSLIATGRF